MGNEQIMLMFIPSSRYIFLVRVFSFVCMVAYTISSSIPVISVAAVAVVFFSLDAVENIAAFAVKI